MKKIRYVIQLKSGDVKFRRNRKEVLNVLIKNEVKTVYTIQRYIGFDTLLSFFETEASTADTVETYLGLGEYLKANLIWFSICGQTHIIELKGDRKKIKEEFIKKIRYQKSWGENEFYYPETIALGKFSKKQIAVSELY